jgi:hypothetical protein
VPFPNKRVATDGAHRVFSCRLSAVAEAIQRSPAKSKGLIPRYDRTAAVKAIVDAKFDVWTSAPSAGSDP